MELAVYTVCYLASYLLDRGGYHCPSGLCLMAAAVWLYISEYRRTGNLVHLRGIFSLFWVGGQGVACLKLSRLQVPWSWVTWLCFYLAFAGFCLTFELLSRKTDGKRPPSPMRGGQAAQPLGGISGAGLFVSVMGVAAFSLAAFCF